VAAVFVLDAAVASGPGVAAVFVLDAAAASAKQKTLDTASAFQSAHIAGDLNRNFFFSI